MVQKDRIFLCNDDSEKDKVRLDGLKKFYNREDDFYRVKVA